MDLIESECEVEDWMHSAYDRDQSLALADTVMNLRVP